MYTHFEVLQRISASFACAPRRVGFVRSPALFNWYSIYQATGVDLIRRKAATNIDLALRLISAPCPSELPVSVDSDTLKIEQMVVTDGLLATSLIIEDATRTYETQRESVRLSEA